MPRWPRNLKVAAHRRTCDFPVEGGQQRMGIAHGSDQPQSGGDASLDELDQVRQGHRLRQATMRRDQTLLKDSGRA